MLRRGAEEARFEQCKGNIFQLAYAVLRYREQYGVFPGPTPTVGGKGHESSWRVAVLPYFGLQELYDRYCHDKDWYNSWNVMLGSTTSAFRCPDESVSDGTRTSYAAVLGRGSLWESRVPGVFERLKRNKVILIEVPASDIAWNEPRDVSIDQLKQTLCDRELLRKNHPNGLNYVSTGPDGNRLGTLVRALSVLEFDQLFNVKD